MHVIIGNSVCFAVSMLLALIGGPFHWPLFLFLWPGFAYGAILLSYAWGSPRLLGKDKKTGSLNKLSLFLLLPYFLGVWIPRLLYLRYSKEKLYTYITDSLYLGGFSNNLQGEPGMKNSIVVDVTAEFWESKHVSMFENDYICHPILDACPSNDEDAYYDLLKRIVREEKRIFVHCAYGHGRSGTLMAILLVLRGSAINVDDAVFIMASCRPGVKLLRNQKIFAERMINRWKADVHESVNSRLGTSPRISLDFA